MARIQIRFDGPPSHESGRFIEVENEEGASIDFGMWKPDGDDWLLVFNTCDDSFSDGFMLGVAVFFTIGFIALVFLAAGGHLI